jgi:FkbM family methyltransferase
MFRTLLPWRRNIFIDCGGNNGCSIRKFSREFDPRGRFVMYTFEPNPIYESSYRSFNNHELIKAAVHDRDGVATFYLDREDGDGSTLFRAKLTRDSGGHGSLDIAAPVQVRTIDLSRWIQQTLRPSDYIILKLDVEGAEYDILEKMSADSSLSRIKHLFVEWHWHKVGVEQSRHDKLLETLKRLSISITEWDAQGY